MRYFKNLLFYICWFLVMQAIIYQTTFNQMRCRSLIMQIRRYTMDRERVVGYYIWDILTPTFLMTILAVGFAIVWLYGKKNVLSAGAIWLEAVLFIFFAVALQGIYLERIRHFLVDWLNIPFANIAYYYSSFSGLLLGWAVVSLLVRLHRKRKAQ